MTAVVISDKFLMLDSFVPIVIYKLIKPMKSMDKLSSESIPSQHKHSRLHCSQQRELTVISIKYGDEWWKFPHIFRGTVERII